MASRSKSIVEYVYQPVAFLCPKYEKPHNHMDLEWKI